MKKTNKTTKKSDGLTEAQMIEMMSYLSESVAKLHRISAAMQIQIDDLSERIEALEESRGCQVRTFTYSH